MSALRKFSVYKRSNRRPDAEDSDNESEVSLVGSRTDYKSSSIRSAFNRFRGKRHDSDETRLDSPTPEPRASSLVKAFSDTLNASNLSNFLIWFLYYDVVRLPESPARWYKPIDSMEMRGWIALGTFFSKHEQHDLELVVLDSICDRLKLRRTLVHECLIHLADPQKMAWTRLATVMKNAKQSRMTELETWEYAQAMLHDLRRLAKCLQPTPESAKWHSDIVDRLGDFLDVVIAPRIALIQKLAPVPTTKSDDEARQLVYLYEAMQQERHVPLVRYGIFPDPYLEITPSTSFGSEEAAAPVLNENILNQACEIESSYCPMRLREELRIARAHNLQMATENRNLIDSNEKLAEKVAMMGRGPSQSHHNISTPITANSSLANVSDYQDVFERLDDKPLPLDLIEPTTGELIQSSSPTNGVGIEHDVGGREPPSSRPSTCGLVCNHGQDFELAIAAQFESSSPLRYATDGSTSCSASDGSRKSIRPPYKSSLDGLGSQNSLAEYRARQVNVSTVQRPITPYANGNSTIFSTLSAARTAAAGIVRRRTNEEGLEASPVDGRKHSSSHRKALDRVLWKDKKEKQELDISTNF